MASRKAAAPAREVKFTNPDKVFFPKTGFTKGDLVQYYLNVAPYLLPHLRERAVTLIRYPDGVGGEKFYEKNAPKFAPGWLQTHDVARRHSAGTTRFIVIDDAAALAWCANLAALELHPFLHRTGDPLHPTHVAFDLDPGEGADLFTCIRVAFLLKAVTDKLGLTLFPKVSGSKGLQLYLPLNNKTSYAAASAFAKAVAEALARQQPQLVVSAMSKALRKDKVMIDWSQNSPSKTTVAVYSIRGKRDEPFVSMPVTWAELTKATRTKKTANLFFSPAEALKRLKKDGDLFAPVLTLKQRLPAAFAAAVAGAQDVAAEPASLEAYRAKRNFAKTREPAPDKIRAQPVASTGRFVIQKHAASRLHYDFRLEMGGVLKSWAVPKGLSTEKGVKRAAFEVEDHPLGYLRFEGTIPKGQYGGGTVMVWDIGTYTLTAGSYESADLKLELKGSKLKGAWHLFRIRTDEKKPVWLIMKSGASAVPISARRDDSSALSRRSMARIAKENTAQWRSR